MIGIVGRWSISIMCISVEVCIKDCVSCVD